MYEEVVVVLSSERAWPAMRQPGRLVPDHLSRGQQHLLAPPVIVLDVERPVLIESKSKIFTSKIKDTVYMKQ